MHFEWVFIAFGKYSVMFFGWESFMDSIQQNKAKTQQRHDKCWL